MQMNSREECKTESWAFHTLNYIPNISQLQEYNTIKTQDESYVRQGN